MNYTQEDKNCTHCGGTLSPHLTWNYKTLIWCDDCGSNNKEMPPNITLETL